jgi:hypothetical protein
MITGKEVKCFESDLNSFDRDVRENALSELKELCATKKVLLNEPVDAHNLHCHTFYSYNGYGFSPSYIAWLARKKGWFAAGTVDFDVLDGVDEFHTAADMFDVRGVSGIETRVFISELADGEINSPGEPGIAYHMGVGFPSGNVPEDWKKFAAEMKAKAAGRTRGIVELVNGYLTPVELDFEKDAVSLTPKGNVTERHACEAYRRKAEEVFPNEDERAGFWAEKLGLSVEDALGIQSDPVKLEGLIRSKTMKRGGVGYVQPDPASFPLLDEMNAFTAACGAVPTVAWLNGESAGESDPGALLDLHIAKGAAFLNIIPDRNWNFSDLDVKAAKVKELNRMIHAAIERDMPIIVGTEMNAPGQKLADDFTSDALAPHVACFVDGAAIAFGHTLLTGFDMGYLSKWANEQFDSKAEKNEFFAAFGRSMTPRRFAAVSDEISQNITPEELLDQL